MTSELVALPDAVGALEPFVAAGVLGPAEVHAAALMTRAGGVPGPPDTVTHGLDHQVVLGAALAVWAPLHGHVCVDLTRVLEMVSREMPAPIGEELSIVVREMSVGVPMIDAFTNMYARVRSLDLDMLVTAITIQHKVGGNLGQILRSISHTIRERLRIKGEIAVLTAQQRLSAIIVSGLPVLVIGALFVIAPTYIMKLFQPGLARMLLIVGGLGIAAGFYCLRKIADIDV